MPREKELFRDNLVRLDAAFPNKEILTKGEVKMFTGRSYATVRKMYDFKGGFISKAKLASQLS